MVGDEGKYNNSEGVQLMNMEVLFINADTRVHSWEHCSSLNGFLDALFRSHLIQQLAILIYLDGYDYAMIAKLASLDRFLC